MYTDNPKEFYNNLNKELPLLGIDPGTKNIGLAISDINKTIATPLDALKNKKYKDLVHYIKEIQHHHGLSGIVIGYPINMDGSLGPSAQSVNDVSKNIDQSVDVDVCLWDERLSTVGAFNLSSQLDVNVSKRGKLIDQNAAAFILQGAIDYLNN